MRTTLDLPDPLLRQLESRAALEGTTLKQLIRDAIERSLGAQRTARRSRGSSVLPSVKLGQPLQVQRLSNAALSGLLDE
ncbi:MAG: ribbon-helix-helix protein, CopG family [Burkholderiaceae bacterium]|nr:ribbon-helix-helix protein, CopG family [Burkholderiaceae bacterium]